MATDEIFNDLLRKPIDVACTGDIGTVFAYGQTGSGQTHTMSGIEEMVAKVLMVGDPRLGLEIGIAFIELVGNPAFDLLKDRSPVALREDDHGVIHWRGATEVCISQPVEMMDLMRRPNALRKTKSTTKNDRSSRSHAICRIALKRNADSTPDHLYLVDLAGSETARDTQTHGAELMRETREINTSLSALKDCIRGKAELQNHRVNVDVCVFEQSYPSMRMSALTKLSKRVFDNKNDRGCKTVVIACLNSSLADVGPSKNTLRYAEMIREGKRSTVKKNIWDR